MKRFAAVAVLLAGCAGKAPAPAPAPRIPARDTEVRSIWVTRMDYKTPDEVKRIIGNVASLGFNVVLFQVRGNGTVFYRSDIEPWAWELTGETPETTGKDPGWDPLALAIAEAHGRGMELHAYVNIFPAWRTQKYPPRTAGQLWWEHPDWFMAAAAGRRMIPRDHGVDSTVGDWYSFISPGVPEVQDYLAKVFGELAARYPIDGIHYDYVRYPHEIEEVQAEYRPRGDRLGNWSYDAVSLARFAHETGAASPDAAPEQWREWRIAQVTATVRKIYNAVSAARPGTVFTASVMPDPAVARANNIQDYLAWLREGLLDGVMTMNYTSDTTVFRNRAALLLAPRPAPGFITQGLILRGSADLATQEIDAAAALGADGYAIFSYGSLFDIRNGHARRPLADQLTARLQRGRAPTPWSRGRASDPGK
ncbi:MAG: hypothetical protein FIB01_07185 [Gemmatimonadetes bacterium]|nr:hypothetical protein [Gemmatimonadota bacterium]